MRTPRGTWIAAAGVLGACGFSPFEALPGDGTLAWGVSFGECIGYCWEEVRITRHEARVVMKGWNGTRLPDRTFEGPVDAATWNVLRRLVSSSGMKGLRNVYGCPDCTDGGAEWVELEADGSTKQVKFEYGDPPSELRALVAYVRAMRSRWPARGEVE